MWRWRAQSWHAALTQCGNSQDKPGHTQHQTERITLPCGATWWSSVDVGCLQGLSMCRWHCVGLAVTIVSRKHATTGPVLGWNPTDSILVSACSGMCIDTKPHCAYVSPTLVLWTQRRPDGARFVDWNWKDVMATTLSPMAAPKFVYHFCCCLWGYSCHHNDLSVSVWEICGKLLSNCLTALICTISDSIWYQYGSKALSFHV